MAFQMNHSIHRMRYFIANEIKQWEIDMLCDGGGNDDFQFRYITARARARVWVCGNSFGMSAPITEMFFPFFNGVQQFTIH